MTESSPNCPSGHSESVVKIGKTRHGKQNYKCRDCGGQFVENHQWQRVRTYAMLTNLLGFEWMWRGLCPHHTHSMRKS